jgi:hypothetical protein
MLAILYDLVSQVEGTWVALRLACLPTIHPCPETLMHAESLLLLYNDHDVLIQDGPNGVCQAQPPSVELKDIHVVSANVGLV